jgi:hypothetical protein
VSDALSGFVRERVAEEMAEFGECGDFTAYLKIADEYDRRHERFRKSPECTIFAKSHGRLFDGRSGLEVAMLAISEIWCDHPSWREPFMWWWNMEERL